MTAKFHITALASVLILGAAGLSQTAFAADNDVPTVTVQYSDLNLSSTQGARSMLQRIRHAANSVCGPQTGHAIDKSARLHDQCVSQAVSRAISKLNAPMVTAIYSGASPTTLASTR